MSEIKVNSIKGVGASTAAITVNSTDGTCTVNNTQRQGKNLVINGEFRIAQRDTSSAANGYTTVDRFNIYHANTGVTCTNSQQALSSSDTPYTLGFRNFYRMALSGAGTANANAEIALYYNFEAQDIACSGWNFKSASSFVTLQFWVRCSTNQTFYCYLQSKDGTEQSYAFSFTASGNNAWTKITKTIPGGSNVDINSDNGTGLTLSIVPFFGTDLTTNKTLDQWSAFSASNRLPDMASTWLTAGASTFDLTGVQLEVGSHSTDFEFLSHAEELRRCQRYYAKYQALGSQYAQFLVTTGYTTDTDSRGMFHFIVEMRVADPSFTYSNSSHFQDLGGKAINIFQLGDSGGTGKNTGIRCIFNGVNTSAGFSHAIRAAATGQAYFAFDAEL
tara:strand:- start:89 stop:1255 length:1167 start_codon:yes stop_codon:yes gene_type:complete